jgi:hypothetical protein
MLEPAQTASAFVGRRGVDPRRRQIQPPGPPRSGIRRPGVAFAGTSDPYHGGPFSDAALQADGRIVAVGDFEYFSGFLAVRLLP